MGRATKVKRREKKKKKKGGNARNLRLYISAFLSASFFLSLKLYFFFVTVVLPVNRNFSPSAIRTSPRPSDAFSLRFSSRPRRGVHAPERSSVFSNRLTSLPRSLPLSPLPLLFILAAATEGAELDK